MQLVSEIKCGWVGKEAKRTRDHVVVGGPHRQVDTRPLRDPKEGLGKGGLGCNHVVVGWPLGHADAGGGLEGRQVLQHGVADVLQPGARVAVLHVADHDAQLVCVQPVVRVVQRLQGQPAPSTQVTRS